MSEVYPVFFAGQTLTADLLTATLTRTVIKSADQTVTSSTALVDDTELLFTAVANASYDVEIRVQLGALLVAGLRTAWSAPTGTSGNKLVSGPGSANAAEANADTTEMRWTVYALTSQAGYTNPRNSTSSLTHVIERARIDVGSTAGAVTFRWAQLASNATGTVVKAASELRYRRVA